MQSVRCLAGVILALALAGPAPAADPSIRLEHLGHYQYDEMGAVRHILGVESVLGDHALVATWQHLCLIDTATFQVVSTFHEYVKPVHHPKLDPFCAELTGITQGMVDEAPEFPEVWRRFQSWLKNETLIDGQGREAGKTKFIFATCGDWDLKTMLPEQLGLSLGMAESPPYMQKFVNVKKDSRIKYPYHYEISILHSNL